MIDVARHIVNYLSAVGQLPGWLHVEQYIRNPTGYTEGKNSEGHRRISSSNLSPSPPVEGRGRIGELMAQGEGLFNRLCRRIAWVWALETKENKAPDANVYMRVISAV